MIWVFAYCLAFVCVIGISPISLVLLPKIFLVILSLLQIDIATKKPYIVGVNIFIYLEGMSIIRTDTPNKLTIYRTDTPVL